MIEKRSVQNSNTNKYFVITCTFLIFSYPFYASNVLPMRVTLAMFMLGVFFVFVQYVRMGWFRPMELRGMMLWVAAAFLVLLSFALSNYSYEYSRFFYPICLALSIGCSLVSSGFKKDWISTSLKTVCIMLVPFAVGTLFLYMFPEVFPSIKAVLFPESVFATGYKSGLTTHYSYNGTYNIVGFIIAFGLAVYSNEAKQSRRAWAIVAILFFCALLLIGKRQTLLFGMMAVVLVYVLSNKKNKIKTLTISVAVLCGVGLLMMYFVPGIENTLIRFFSSFGNDDIGEVTSSRDVIWVSAFTGWLEHPLFGNGWGTFSYQFSETNTVHVAHNELLDLLYSVGIVGSLVFVACMMSTLLLTIRLFYNAQRDRIQTVIPHAKTILSISLMIQIYDISMGFSIGSILGSPTSFMPYLLAVGITLYCYRNIRLINKQKHSFFSESSCKEGHPNEDNYFNHR